jgi:AraC-like DNA-binding protein
MPGIEKLERHEKSADRAIVASYREFAPREELRDYVRAFFSFVPGTGARVSGRPVLWEASFRAGESFCSPFFADAGGSIVVQLGMTCRAQGIWQSGALDGNVIGPMSGVGPTDLGCRPAMIGAYFMPARISSLVHLPASELTDRVVTLGEVWGSAGSPLPAQLAELDESARIEHLEAALLRQLTRRRVCQPRVNVAGLIAWVVQHRGCLPVERLSDAAGVSRQHLARVFRESIGVRPKLYCRLARFHSALAYAGRGDDVQWAQAAAALGYADQSHMIAEFREFSSLTPQRLATEQWFHPFIERAKARNWSDRPREGRRHHFDVE